jgi:L-amino acid N-acyltransferase YncA
VRWQREYPRALTLDGVAWKLRPMTGGDRDALLALARSIPEHDQLFLRRDITRPEVVDRWIAELESGELVTVLAERDGAIDGYATVQPDRDTWSPHVAELRVHVAPDQKAAQRAFEDLGFRLEGLLRDYVKDRTGRTHDLLVMSHDVERFHAMLEAFGVADALGG